jgi:hypothetical protein
MLMLAIFTDELSFSFSILKCSAPDLHSVGGLVPVIKYLRSSNARIRAKAADVVTTVVQNNPTSQHLVMEASGFEPLLSNFRTDPDLTARIKALGALSCKYFCSFYLFGL